jgi:hypothetical protein
MANEKPATQFYALRITLYAFNPQLTTRNPQPDFGANAPPTHKFHASRFTHHAHFSKIANFAVKSVKSRITNHAPDGYQMTPEVVII